METLCNPIPLTAKRPQFGGVPKSPPHPCKLCGRTCPGRRPMCSPCGVRLRRYVVKAAAVAHLGGVAVCCGFDGDLAGFCFHHVGGKEFQISGTFCRRWEVLKAELAKCELWCCRCHAIHHSAYASPGFAAVARDHLRQYKGCLPIVRSI